jgi:Mg2+-importing ATPase
MATAPDTITQAATGAKKPFWTLTAEEHCAPLGCGQSGLSTADAAGRLRQFGQNADAQQLRISPIRAFLLRFLEPLSLILLAAGIVSIATGDAIGGAIIVAILSLSRSGWTPSRKAMPSRPPRSCAVRWH